MYPVWNVTILNALAMDSGTSGWPSGLRRQTQVKTCPIKLDVWFLVLNRGRGFKSHFWHTFIYLFLFGQRSFQLSCRPPRSCLQLVIFRNHHWIQNEEEAQKVCMSSDGNGLLSKILVKALKKKHSCWFGVMVIKCKIGWQCNAKALLNGNWFQENKRDGPYRGSNLTYRIVAFNVALFFFLQSVCF